MISPYINSDIGNEESLVPHTGGGGPYTTITDTSVTYRTPEVEEKTDTSPSQLAGVNCDSPACCPGMNGMAPLVVPAVGEEASDHTPMAGGEMLGEIRTACTTQEPGSTLEAMEASREHEPVSCGRAGWWDRDASICSSARDTRTVTIKTGAALSQIAEGVHEAEVSAIRDRLRECGGDKKAVSDLKKELPGMCWSGRFSHRSGDALEEHSGLLCIDVDDLKPEDTGEFRRRITEDPHTLACFASPTGTGLKVLVPLDGFDAVPDPAAYHRHCFRTVERYYQNTLGIGIDSSGKDVNRLCFMSHDPWLYRVENALPFTAEERDLDTGCKPSGTSLPPGYGIYSESDTPVLQRAIRYLETMDPAVKGSHGHDKLLHAAVILRRGFSLDREATVKILWTHYNPRCIPPWNRDDPEDVRDFERKADEAMKMENTKTEGWLVADVPVPAGAGTVGTPEHMALAGGEMLEQGAGTADNHAAQGVLKQDGRTKTSPENGAKGGRPRINNQQLGQEFLATQRDADGCIRLRVHRDIWYEYKDGRYLPLRLGDLKSRVTAWLHKNHYGLNSKNTRDNIIGDIDSADLCLVPGGLDMPLWLRDDGSYTDASEWMVCTNKLVHVRNMARVLNGEPLAEHEWLRDHTPRLFTTRTVDYAFDPTAEAPMWVKYLSDIQDAEGTVLLRKLAGLGLVKDTGYNVSFFLQGIPGTGKSTYTNVLRELVGRDNTYSLELAQFADKYKVEKLTTTLLNIVGDACSEENGRYVSRQAESIFKEVCSGSTVATERKYQTPGQAPVTARCVFALNDLPFFHDRSGAIADRMRLIPFDIVQRYKSTQIKDLDKLIIATEMPGVLNWAVAGLAALMADPAAMFPEHPVGLERKNDHMKQLDPERMFLEERYQKGTAVQFIVAEDMYNSYRPTVLASGGTPLKQSNFYAAVERVFKTKRTRMQIDGQRMYVFSGLVRREL